MKQNKLVIFDWGGVVESHLEGMYNFRIVIKNILKRMGVKEVPDDYLVKCVTCEKFAAKKHMFCCNDEKDIESWIKMLLKTFELDNSKEQVLKFIKVYKEEFLKVDYFKNVAEYARSLNEECYTGILSNLYFLDKERIDRHFNLSKFDFVWLSCDLGMMKPNEDIYKKVLKDSKFKPDDILFIDDKVENLRTAHSLGFHTYLATGEDFENIKYTINDFLYK